MSSLIDSNSKFAINPTQIGNIVRSKFDMSHTPVSYTHLDVYKRQPRPLI